MAILNITPDSFSDGGVLTTPAEALAAARAALAEGADILDLGGESTRPGAEAVPADEQIRRVIPAIDAIRRAGIDAPITIDTTSAEVAAAGLDAGADAVNDVSAGLGDPAMLGLIADRRVGVVLMHRRSSPREDRFSHLRADEPDYGPAGVLAAVREYLDERARAAVAAGVGSERIALDPGLGFGKSVRQNYALIAGTREIVDLGHPVVAASSRKSFLGAVSGSENPVDRGIESVAAAVLQRWGGAGVFRVHDVAEHRRALAVADEAIAAAGICGWSG